MNWDYVIAAGFALGTSGILIVGWIIQPKCESCHRAYSRSPFDPTSECFDCYRNRRERKFSATSLGMRSKRYEDSKGNLNFK